MNAEQMFSDGASAAAARTEDDAGRASSTTETSTTESMSAEEGDPTAATRPATATAQDNEVCIVCQYRERKLKHT